MALLATLILTKTEQSAAIFEDDEVEKVDISKFSKDIIEILDDNNWSIEKCVKIFGKFKSSIKENHDISDMIVRLIIIIPNELEEDKRKDILISSTMHRMLTLKIINETAVIYREFIKGTENGNYMLIQLDDSNFEVKILALKEGLFETVAKKNDHGPSGENFDKGLEEYFFKKLTKEKGPLSNEKKEDLKKHCRNARDKIPYEMEDFEIAIFRGTFDDINKERYDLMKNVIDESIKMARLTKEAIHHVVFICGWTPDYVKETLGLKFSKKITFQKPSATDNLSRQVLSNLEKYVNHEEDCSSFDQLIEKPDPMYILPVTPSTLSKTGKIALI